MKCYTPCYGYGEWTFGKQWATSCSVNPANAEWRKSKKSLNDEYLAHRAKP